VLQSLAQRALLPGGDCTVVPVTLQAKSSHGQNQAAHQVLGELAKGGAYLYTLAGLTQDEIKTIAYCTSAVSDIDREYNYADNYLEACVRGPYELLAQNIIAGDPVDRGAIWERLIRIFRDACVMARMRARSDHRDAAERPRIMAIIAHYGEEAAALLARRDQVAARDADYWINLVATGGF